MAVGGDAVLQAARFGGKPLAGLEQVAADQQHGVGTVEIQDLVNQARPHLERWYAQWQAMPASRGVLDLPLS